MLGASYRDVPAIVYVTEISMDQDLLHGFEHGVEVLQVAVFGLPDVT